ncbi:MAG: amidohydrolase [Thermodesulfobacteriota bacterium]
MNSYDILISNGHIVTLDEQNRVLLPGAVAVSGGRIEKILGPGDPPPPAKTVLDAGGGIVMPGLVNCHTHLPMSLFRGLADDMALDEWLQRVIFPAEAKFVDPEFVGLGSELSLAEMLLSGTTCICDGYFHEHHAALTVEKAGIRAVLGQGVIGFPAPGAPDPARNVEVAEEFVSTWLGKSPLITPSIFCHSPYTCSAETLISAKRKALDLGVLFQIHVSESADEVAQSLERTGMTPVAYLDSLGVLDSSTLLVHAVHADPTDIEIIAKHSCGVAIATGSHCKLASGIAPLPAFLDLGVPVGLGTDGSSSNNRLCMFREMDLTAKLHKVHTQDPTSVPARTALALATRCGAAALGLSGEIGSLAPGMQADLVVLSSDCPNLTPVFDPASAAVYAATGADVRHVMVAGRLLVLDRRLITLDLPDLLERARVMGRKIRSECDGISRAC